MKKISLLYVLLFVASATFFVATKLSNAQTSTTTATTTATSTPYLNVVSPVGNRIHLFGSRVYVAWNAQNVDVDYYYVLLENTALKNIGFVVSDNISPSTTTTNFEFNKNIIDTVLANSGGLTEGQLQDGYYVRVIGIKKGSPYNNAVINATSGVFSVSNSLGLIISSASANLGPVVTNENMATVQSYTISLIVTNNGRENIYIRNVGDNRDAIINSSINSATSTHSINVVVPSVLSGDGAGSLVVPMGSSRQLVYNGILRNNGQLQPLTFNMSGIVYGKASAWPNGYILEVTSPALKLQTVLGDNGTDSNGSSSPIFNIYSPVSEVTYAFNSPISVVWNAKNVDASYYYVILENTALKDYGFVVSDNIPVSTTSINFTINKKIIDTILEVARTKGLSLSENQIKDSYYVRVVGIKGNQPQDKSVVINKTSGLFSVYPSSGLLASNASIKLGSPVYVNNIPIAQPYEMSLTIYSKETVYIRNKGDGRDLRSKTLPSTATSTSPVISAKPDSLSGDGISHLIIPAGSYRTISYYGSLKNDGPVSVVTHEITGIVYGKSSAWPEGYVLDLSNMNLEISATFGTGKVTNINPVVNNVVPTSTSMVSPKVTCPAGYICNPKESSSYCPSGYVCNKVTVGCPTNYNCTTVTKPYTSTAPVPSSTYSPVVTPNYYYTPGPTTAPTYSTIPSPAYSPISSPVYSPTPVPAVTSAPVSTPSSSPSPTTNPVTTYSPTVTPEYSSVPSPASSVSPSPSSSAINYYQDNFRASIWDSLKNLFFVN